MRDLVPAPLFVVIVLATYTHKTHGQIEICYLLTMCVGLCCPMKKRINISMSDPIRKKAQILMKLRDFGDFSSFLEDLIRSEWECRNGKSMVSEPAAPFRSDFRDPMGPLECNRANTPTKTPKNA